MATNRARSSQELNEDNLRTLVQEMQWVRRLLMLQVLASGYKQKHIAAALGVSEATMSRMTPKSLPAFKNGYITEN